MVEAFERHILLDFIFKIKFSFVLFIRDTLKKNDIEYSKLNRKV